MTNEQAAEILKGYKQRLENSCSNLLDEDLQAFDLAIKALEDRPTGEWIKGQEISRTMIGDKIEHIEYKDYTCSNCGLVIDNLLYNYDGSPFYKFCPNCGAKMKGEEK